MIQTSLQHPVMHALNSCLDGGIVLAAVSGGPDSMAMFHALCELARERGELRVVAAHFDHRLRPDSDRDAETVEHVAARFGVRVVRGSADVAAHARDSRQSIEAAARELRYAFLERAADETGANVIATAHTRSDQIETVLMRILRGADARGLRGIPARRGRIVRPLLAVSRAETVAYCAAHGVPCVDDASNADRRFFRNRIRHDVLPSLRRAYPGLDAALERLSRSAHLNFDDAERVTHGRLDAWLRAESPGTWTLSLRAFDGLDDEHRLHLISGAINTMDAQNNVTRPHYHSLLDLVRAAPGTCLDLPGTRVRREHDALVFMRRDMDAGAGEWKITSHPVSGDEARRALGGIQDARVAYLATEGPLTVRFPRPGDRMIPFGMSGHKKLSDLFIDRKIPQRERARTPVVESNGEILWVVGVATSESARIDHHTSTAVRLTATREGMTT